MIGKFTNKIKSPNTYNILKYTKIKRIIPSKGNKCV